MILGNNWGVSKVILDMGHDKEQMEKHLRLLTLADMWVENNVIKEL